MERCEICTRRFASRKAVLKGVQRVIYVCTRKQCLEMAKAELLHEEHKRKEAEAK